MKKSLIALAALAIAGVASAQSSVTLYGVADASYGYVKSGSDKRIAPNLGNLSGSRVGIKGAEDLGNGLKATFNYEWSLDSVGGALQASSASGDARQGWVGLAGEFGEIRYGRTNTPVDNLVSSTLADGASNFGVQGSAGHTSRVRGVHYVGNFSGLGVQAFFTNAQRKQGNQLAVLNSNVMADPTSTAKAQAYGVGVTYANGPLTVGGAVQQFKTTHLIQSVTPSTSSVTTGPTTTAGSLVAPAVAPTGTTLALKSTEMAVGGAYDFGAAKLHVNYVHNKLDTETTVTGVPGVARGSSKNRELNTGVTVPFGAATLVAEYGYNKDQPKDLKHDFMVGANYAFSKRTDTYVRFAQRGKNTSKTQMTAVGLRHKF